MAATLRTIEHRKVHHDVPRAASRVLLGTIVIVGSAAYAASFAAVDREAATRWGMAIVFVAAASWLVMGFAAAAMRGAAQRLVNLIDLSLATMLVGTIPLAIAAVGNVAIYDNADTGAVYMAFHAICLGTSAALMTAIFLINAPKIGMPKNEAWRLWLLVHCAFVAMLMPLWLGGML